MPGAYFLTWRLHGSLPAGFNAEILTTDGAKFRQADRLLDSVATGPKWLADPNVAAIVAKVLLAGRDYGKYELGAWVLMPNHVHAVIRSDREAAYVVRTIKARSARECNAYLNRAGRAFWAKDYFDRWIRDGDEEGRIVRYIEYNPVKAGLCGRPEEWLWSSANAAC